MSAVDFEWSTQRYSLKHFVRNFSDKLPVVITVTQGYCGLSDFTTFGIDETYIITEVRHQKRVVVQTSGNKVLSIPVDHPLKFQVVSNNDVYSNPEGLEDILKNHNDEVTAGGFHIVPWNIDKISFCIGADRKEYIPFDMLEILNTYSDVFLVACPINHGHVYESRLSIPVFVDIQFAQAKGLVNQKSVTYFHQILANLQAEATSFVSHEAFGNPEIMLYDKSAKDCSEYEYLPPQHYITCLEATEIRRKASAAKVQTSKESLPVQPPGPLPPKANNRRTSLNKRVVPPPPEDIEDEDNPVLRSALPHIPSIRGQTRQRGDGKSWHEGYIEMSGNGSKKGEIVLSLSDSIDYELLEQKGKGFDASSQGKVGKVDVDQDDDDYELFYPGPGENPAEDDDLSPYSNVSYIPKDISSLDKYDVANCLRILKLEKYITAFAEHDVDGELLSNLTEEHIFMEQFKFTEFEARKLVKFVKGWRPK